MSERHHLEDTCIDRRIILKWIVKKSVGKTWTGLIWLRRGTVGGNAVMNLRVS
jgi:hypothetical protein